MSTAASPAPRVRSANIRQAYDLALAGAIGAVFGLYLYTELVRTDAIWLRDALAGVAIGGAIGFFLNAAEPLRDGAWLKLTRNANWGALA
ncbi:MAG: FHA domain-containing protein, partial [Isosphaeraceae bacterium]|nr:FHA domain-containing protein [Isosphaeraceae bacterium]